MNNEVLSGSYSPDDVIFLLKEISDSIAEQSTEYREKAIQSGTHYSEMLPIEYEPTEEYTKIFHDTLDNTKEKIAQLVSILCEKILKSRGNEIVLVSLARAGTPICILVKRYLKLKYNIDLPHYCISIIRDIGVDENALLYIQKKHPNMDIQFIDGWTGKGVIQNTLKQSCENFYRKYNIRINSNLAVLSDPGWICNTYATREDFLIPNACLNSTVSGLMSRTVYNKKLISNTDFHGSKFYKELQNVDLSNHYVDTISTCYNSFSNNIDLEYTAPDFRGLNNVHEIQKLLNIDNINLIKPGVGETTRVLLRRIPRIIYVDSFNNHNLKHIYKLAEEKNVPLELYSSNSYSCFGIIKQV